MTLPLHGFIKKSENGGQATAQKKFYDNDFKIQAVKLGKEIGFSNAAKELGVNTDTLYGWNNRAKDARLDRTVYSIMEEIVMSHRPNRKPNCITKADRNARKSDYILKRDFTAEKPLEKCVTDITEIPARDGKLYVSALFDCYDLVGVLGLAMTDNMKSELCIHNRECL